MKNLIKPLIVRKGGTQLRVNLPARSNFNVLDEVAIIPYQDYKSYKELKKFDIKKTLENTNNEKTELEKQIVNLKKELDITRKELTAEKENNRKLNNSINSKNEEILTLNKHLTKIIEENRHIVEKNSHNNSKIAVLNKEIEHLENKLLDNYKHYQNYYNNLLIQSEEAIKDIAKESSNYTAKQIKDNRGILGKIFIRIKEPNPEDIKEAILTPKLEKFKNNVQYIAHPQKKTCKKINTNDNSVYY